ncbi:hypothetical protein Ssi03_35970 [Sphaerisporangium siamense]|uniref:YiaAB two helix domain-containing protein n=2 Tax=Sphaerisporangium TaxID=321315 RepID=A0A7W8Z5S4_9ACTN|nr:MULTISPECIES: YiaA/YiaB family inner membrane protein [Sphaerisporangium]MBB4701483.1 hypothetical protein [Sphaerisporangium siamense]MBB5628017.1 hypothetical protein [Sphaerisporangium krabiense]GII62181.1 hypothetical protein Skr01_22660 [Sphaerisporangium krabiense]GII85607.1 hypothetical protein Ssi03_35970 [Sphaerisporangium siamense]
MTKPIHPTLTTAYYAQCVLSFGVALGGLAIGIAYLPVDPWVRAFLAVATLYAVTSAFVLAKCVRDRHEVGAVTTRVDQARLDKLLAEHDPYKVESL